jgi:hypothetical protein
MLALTATPAPAQDDAFAKAVPKVEVRFEPAEAKRGETVTLKVTLYLADKYHTYPTAQPNPKADAMANRFTWPEAGAVVFVGSLTEPEKPTVKDEPGIGNLHTYAGKPTWERKVVVSPDAKPGEQVVKLKLRVLVCDENSCLPPRTVPLEAKLKVTDAAAVPVEEKYKAEVEKARSAKP